MRKLLMITSAIMGLGCLYPTTISAQTCTAAPSCADMGYTKTVSDCSGKTTLKCPFDLSAVSCEEEDSSSSSGGAEWDWENMLNCSKLTYTTETNDDGHLIFNYTAPVGGCVFAGGYGSETYVQYIGISGISGNVLLPLDVIYGPYTACLDAGYIFKVRGGGGSSSHPLCYFIPYKNAEKLKDNNSCLNGDYYFDDGTCSFFNIAGKTVIGIVVNAENRIIISMEKQGSLMFATDAKYYTNVYKNLTSTSDGQLNMNKLVSAGITKFPVAQFCKGLTVGNKTWYVPASEEFVMNERIASNIGAGSTAYFWTSTQSDSSKVITKRGTGANNTASASGSTSTTRYAICVAKY